VNINDFVAAVVAEAQSRQDTGITLRFEGEKALSEAELVVHEAIEVGPYCLLSTDLEEDGVLHASVTIAGASGQAGRATSTTRGGSLSRGWPAPVSLVDCRYRTFAVPLSAKGFIHDGL
jgi:hypothetical protein